jgi:hypothetical protein
LAFTAVCHRANNSASLSHEITSHGVTSAGSVATILNQSDRSTVRPCSQAGLLSVARINHTANLGYQTSTTAVA